MFGKRKQTAEIGRWLPEDEDGNPVKGFVAGGKKTAWANVGSAENAKKLFDLTDDQIAAIRECGFIEIDSTDGVGTITLEAGYGF